MIWLADRIRWSVPSDRRRLPPETALAYFEALRYGCPDSSCEDRHPARNISQTQKKSIACFQERDYIAPPGYVMQENYNAAEKMRLHAVAKASERSKSKKPST